MIIKEIEAKNVITKSNLPVCDFSVNPYTGCEHACKYCYACFMKRFTNHHPEEWGEFVDVKIWQPIKTPGKYKGKELFIGSVTISKRNILLFCRCIKIFITKAAAVIGKHLTRSCRNTLLKSVSIMLRMMTG